MLPPQSKGLQPGLSESMEVWRGVLTGAACNLKEQQHALDRKIKGPPSLRQTLVRAYQVCNWPSADLVSS